MNNGDYTVICDYCRTIIGTYAGATTNNIPQSNFDLPLPLSGIKVGNRHFFAMINVIEHLKISGGDIY